MNLYIKTLTLPILFIFFVTGISFSQDKLSDANSFDERLEYIELLTDTEQYSKSMIELRKIEKSEIASSSIENQVKIKTLLSRTLRLSERFDESMVELSEIPNLDQHPKLKLLVDFRKAALYSENGKYTFEERISLLYPLINNGIITARKLKDKGMLASFLNLKAAMHRDECTYLNQNCVENRELAKKAFNESLSLFSELRDTNNYHNTLNGLFRLSLDAVTDDIDSISEAITNITKQSNYAPNIITSRNLLGAYYKNHKKDSIKFLWEVVKARDEMINLTNKNTDNAIGKLKLYYEFDSLKSNISSNKKIVDQQNHIITQKSQQMRQIVFFGIALGILIIILIISIIRQRRLTKRLDKSNLKLKQSNNSYQLLIKESNHRIKNNLQMISSMLELDKSNANEQDAKLLFDISTKISTISALNSILDFTKHNQKISLPVYFKEIISSYQSLNQGNLKFDIDIYNIELRSERIIYFGLILNEMLSNTINHRGKKDEIVIKIIKIDNKNIFRYADQSNFGTYTKNNGISLIEGLVGRFGGENLTLNSQTGEYQFHFNTENNHSL